MIHKFKYSTALVAILVIGSVEPFQVGPKPSYLAALRQNSSNGSSSPPQLEIPHLAALIQNLSSSVSQKPMSPYLLAALRPATKSNPPNSGHKVNYGYEKCSTNYNFDFLILSLQWGPGFCTTSSQECSRIVNDRFTIHGLWPSSMNNLGPSDCCFDNTFDAKSINALMPDLDYYWCSYFGQDSTHFWSHEWIKHGTCARDIPELRGEKRYFGNTLRIVKALPILGTLKRLNIVPSANQKYKVVAIRDALMQISNGKNIQMQCDLNHTSPTPILTGLKLCYDHKLKLIDCPHVKNRCRDEILFLS